MIGIPWNVCQGKITSLHKTTGYSSLKGTQQDRHTKIDKMKFSQNLISRGTYPCTSFWFMHD